MGILPEPCYESLAIKLKLLLEYLNNFSTEKTTFLHKANSEGKTLSLVVQHYLVTREEKHDLNKCTYIFTWFRVCGKSSLHGALQ